MLRRFILTAVMLAAGLAMASPPPAQDRKTMVASTTSIERLFGHLLPIFTRESGVVVRAVAPGTGQALDVGRRGDADVVFVHDREAEERFVADGFGGPRRHVMFNDVAVIGPAADPARVLGLRDTTAAVRRIATARALFIGRGDRSGTLAAELRLWQQAGADPVAGRGAWYREVGQGKGPVLC